MQPAPGDSGRAHFANIGAGVEDAASRTDAPHGQGIATCDIVLEQSRSRRCGFSRDAFVFLDGDQQPLERARLAFGVGGFGMMSGVHRFVKIALGEGAVRLLNRFCTCNHCLGQFDRRQ